MPTYSWFGGAYQSASLVADVPPDYAATFAAVSGGNPSAKGTAVLEDPFPRLESCVKPNGSAVCEIYITVPATLHKRDKSDFENY
jgi:hypothetical protein